MCILLKMELHFCIWGIIIFGFTIQILHAATTEDNVVEYMSKEEREALKEESRDMFYHAYNAYMDNAYPADELMPLSCKGRYRGSEPSRGDIDSTLGNFSLTLVDTLDTLVVLGDLEEFENAVKLVVKDVTFDTDVIVSLFETNIRILGGLLSGHILSEYLQQRADIMPWYRGELLNMAKDLGYRFLPAFNTTTGIPYGRINLRHGMKGVPIEVSRETCTACAGSMILEMAALSRLTGEPIFEEKAQKAMDVLWRMRHRGTDLMGSVLNVNSGDWVRRDSGVGAGIDSYYEYCLKAYILLGDEKYLGRFNKHYQAIMKYISQGPMLLDVHMHRPNTNSKNFMDALLAFWPGLQVLKGDIKPAVETHEMLYQVMQRHNFIPEAFTTDFQVHWGHHPLRPEFLESTYFLYKATGDHYYLGVGQKVLKSLQTYARVPCGYAAVSDVRTNKHDDTMDSFVLSETFKYLFLLFAEPNELVLDLDEFIFTTEGHLLPLTLASVRTNVSSVSKRDIVHVDELDRTCPNSLHLFPASVRQPLRNMVEDVCPRRNKRRRLSAAQFQANNLEHLKMLSDMGITILTLADGRVQLLHTFSNAKTPQDSEEGFLFMQEMAELSRMQSQQIETKPQAVSFIKPKTNPPREVVLLAGPARFGPDIQSFGKTSGRIVFTYPSDACTDLLNEDKLVGKVAVTGRGNCMFIEKARRIQKAGAIAGIVLDNVVGSSAATSPMFAMTGDGKELDDITIPFVFLFSAEANELMKAIVGSGNEDLEVSIGEFIPKDEVQLKAPTDLSMFERLKGSLRSFLNRQTILTHNSKATTSNEDDKEPTRLTQSVEEKENREEIEASDENEAVKEKGDVQKNIINYRHLSAEIINDSLGGEIRIAVVSDIPAVVVKKESDLLEKQWRQLREVFVQQIYFGNAQYQIRTSILTSYYKWVLKNRGVKNTALLNEADLPYKVLWFLKELSKVEIALDQLLDITRKKLLKQRLLTNMDIMVLNLKSIANKMEKIKTVVNNYSFLRHLLQEAFDGEDESINQHIALLDHFHTFIHKLYQSILLEGSKRTLENLNDFDASHYDILIEAVQKSDLGTKNTEQGSEIDDIHVDDQSEVNKDELKKGTKSYSDSLKKSKGESLKKINEFELILSEIGKALKKMNMSKNLDLQNIKSGQDPAKSSDILNSILPYNDNINKNVDDIDGPIKHYEKYLENIVQTRQDALRASQSQNKDVQENRKPDSLDGHKQPVWISDTDAEKPTTKSHMTQEFSKTYNNYSPEYSKESDAQLDKKIHGRKKKNNRQIDDEL
ncbi:ER degradation-enhancing alpha-mannosidase-like protein 3 isoform X2 [Prorops nasuta]|uniref:ER degradation-enhancing alpha-mannosidase-like protein 3 isoform X2 n=1 Tax=Prorops nasuta TaxID=863751 RepID=UPI0034CD4B04